MISNLFSELFFKKLEGEVHICSFTMIFDNLLKLIGIRGYSYLVNHCQFYNPNIQPAHHEHLKKKLMANEDLIVYLTFDIQALTLKYIKTGNS